MSYRSVLYFRDDWTERGRDYAEAFGYCSELATLENALLALDPIKRTVPTTRTKITANMTAYSAISWPDSSDHSLRIKFDIFSPPRPRYQSLERVGLI